MSVLVPVYNERYLVASSLQRLRILSTSPHLERIDRFLPVASLSLIAVLRKASSSALEAPAAA